MLGTRVITAAALLMVLLPALFFLPSALWRYAVLLVLAVASWEWARLARFSGKYMWAFVILTAIAGGILQAVFPGAARASYGIAFVFWVLVVPIMFLTALRPSGWLAAIAGWCVLLPFASAVVDLREMGPWLLVSVMALVWVADIAAYFFGRAFGAHKLAPAISPGKTWEGVAGAVLATTVYALANVYLGNPLFGQEPVWRGVLIAATLLTAVSVIGDLFESAMKRSAGLKDSSNLLPGHGGVLDRIDSLTSTLPLAALLLIWGGKL